MPKYAAGTTVSRDSSLQEIERELARFGATGFQYGWRGSAAAIGFEIHGMHLRITVEMPDRTNQDAIYDEAYELSRQARKRMPATPEAQYELVTRRRWRAMALIIKAKLVAIDDGVRTFEQEFGTDIVMANGQTVGEWLAPQLARARLTGTMPPLLPGPKE